MPPCASRPVQLRDPSSLTSEAYVAQCAWQCATLASCPRHPGGGCGFVRHGTYARKSPAGMRIARYYLHGPSVHDADDRRRHKTYLIALLDDATRIIPAAACARSETVAAFLPVLDRAVRRRGLPKRSTSNLCPDTDSVFCA